MNRNIYRSHGVEIHRDAVVFAAALAQREPGDNPLDAARRELPNCFRLAEEAALLRVERETGRGTP